jgi:ThiS family
VNIYLNDEDIRYLSKEQTPLNDHDVLSIVPSIAGGVALGVPTGRVRGADSIHPFTLRCICR